MKYVVRKAFWDYEKEEKYLNSMSARGLALTDYSWCRYVFEDASPGKYIYRLELLENRVNHPESLNYIKFMEENGVEFVSSYMRWVYFRKKASEGPFAIYTDLDSRIRHYARIRSFFMFLFGINLAAGLVNLIIGIIDSSTNLFNAATSIVLAGFIFIFLVRPLNRKIRKLKNEKNIRE